MYWRLTRLDFAATTTLPPDLYDGLDPTPAASVLAYTDSCTNAVARDKSGVSEKRFYKGLIRKADDRFEAHLARLKKEGK